MNDELDIYDTDDSVIIDLLKFYPLFKNKELKVLDPCAGAGTLGDKFKLLTNNTMYQYDIEPRRDDIQQIDYMNLLCHNEYNLIITNLPDKENNKNGFTQLLFKALNDIKNDGYVCNLQKIKSLESKERYEKIYSRRRPERILLYSHRLKCKKNNKLYNTQTQFCWCIWHKDSNGFFSNQTFVDWIY